jgi:XRE family transcriptional regulator, aerobic/anaerobic benzoate catabolism transcriptional regulator
MSSTILHHSSTNPEISEPADLSKSSFLTALGERVKAIRARQGLTRKALAVAADVSERHLANLEYGVGNASILILVQVAQALQCSLAELLGDITTSSPEWLMLRRLLEQRDEATLRSVRLSAAAMLGEGVRTDRNRRIALIGLRGAGKSTLGEKLSKYKGVPFIELSREIEKLAGGSTSEIQALYGLNAYRRYERKALEEAIATQPDAVIATPGGLVTDPASFNLLLAQCTTVWLQAAPEDHMKRVIAQGDMRPMADSKEAMEDLKGILAGREAYYSKADFLLNTSGQSLDSTFNALQALVM